VLALGALGRAATTGTLRAAVIASDAAPDAPFADTRDAAFAPLAIYEDAAAAAAKDGARVIVLPERITAVRAWWRDELDARLRALADRTGAVIVVGVGDFASSPAQNRARVYRPHATPLAYAKHHLIPGLEDAFAPGDAPLAIEVDGHAIGVAICKDLDFEDTARAAAGVAALLVPAWDFTVDAELHDRMALVRGVEGGFAVVRAARTGWIAIHDAGGHTIAEAPSAAPVVARVVDVPLAGGGTPFAVIGRAFGPLALLCAIAIALALALGVRRARRR
jgi:apolipoprotein N-acyltransferase